MLEITESFHDSHYKSTPLGHSTERAKLKWFYANTGEYDLLFGVSDKTRLKQQMITLLYITILIYWKRGRRVLNNRMYFAIAVIIFMLCLVLDVDLVTYLSTSAPVGALPN